MRSPPPLCTRCVVELQQRLGPGPRRSYSSRIARPKPRFELAVVRLSHFKEWRFSAPGWTMNEAMTLDAQHVYVGLGICSEPTSSVRKSLRIALSQLDSVSTDLSLSAAQGSE